METNETKNIPVEELEQVAGGVKTPYQTECGVPDCTGHIKADADTPEAYKLERPVTGCNNDLNVRNIL